MFPAVTLFSVYWSCDTLTSALLAVFLSLVQKFAPECRPAAHTRQVHVGVRPEPALSPCHPPCDCILTTISNIDDVYYDHIFGNIHTV